MREKFYKSIVVRECARGFTATKDNFNTGNTETYAFDKIEDLAKWLVEQYDVYA